MNRKNKAFAFIAAAAVSLSLTTGVMAQTTSDTENVSATLAAGACSASLTADGNFGTWVYNGATEVYETDDDSTVDLDLTVTEGAPGAGCSISASFSGLNRVGGGGSIPFGNFQATADGFGTLNPLTMSSYGPVTVPAGDYSGSLTLNSIPPTNPLGTYTGTISVTFPTGA